MIVCLPSTNRSPENAARPLCTAPSGRPCHEGSIYDH
jgi:hypothetical protein